MYNQFHNRSQFKFGASVTVLQCSGIDSGKEARVINHFNWEEEQGAYKRPDNTYIPIQFSNGDKSYMSRYRLTVN